MGKEPDRGEERKEKGKAGKSTSLHRQSGKALTERADPASAKVDGKISRAGRCRVWARMLC